MHGAAELQYESLDLSTKPNKCSKVVETQAVDFINMQRPHLCNSKACVRNLVTFLLLHHLIFFEVGSLEKFLFT